MHCMLLGNARTHALACMSYTSCTCTRHVRGGKNTSSAKIRDEDDAMTLTRRCTLRAGDYRRSAAAAKCLRGGMDTSIECALVKWPNMNHKTINMFVSRVFEHAGCRITDHCWANDSARAQRRVKVSMTIDACMHACTDMFV